jgi:Autographiviridae endonuclease VII
MPSIPLCPTCKQSPRYKKLAYCRECYNAYMRVRMNKRRTPEISLRSNLKDMYDLSIEEYKTMLAKQNGLCACCGQAETHMNYRTKQTQRLSVDHDHTTGIVRGLVCRACNVMIGYIEQDASRVKMAQRYLTAKR